MKIRWREHELVFATTLAITLVILLLWKEGSPAYESQKASLALTFKENGLTFHYWQNALLPKLAVILLAYLAYLSINLLVIRLIKKIVFANSKKLQAFYLFLSFFAIASVSYMLAIGTNMISYYAHPHLFNYADYQFLSLLGYNDSPLTAIFFGFDRAIRLVLLLTGLAGIREYLIYLINRSGAAREFRVLVINNTTPILFIYLLVPFFLNPTHNRFMDYLAWATPVLAIYIYETFWLFPFSENHNRLHRPFISRLLLATFLGAVFSAIVFSGSRKLLEFSVFWLILLLVVTPLTWMLYQLRRDKILQLKGMEKALVASTANLQLLRSQINPHFLFNSLNTLYGTALKEKADQTAEGIQLLGDMMRFMLHENNLDFIPINKEVDYLKNYIILQKLRTASSPTIQIKDDIADHPSSRTIAPMLLIPFIENAFKHGISFREKSWIHIKLGYDQTFICFEVRNSKHPKPKEAWEKEGSGIGITNVTERLKLSYPGKHTLEIGERENEFFVRLTIN